MGGEVTERLQISHGYRAMTVRFKQDVWGDLQVISSWSLDKENPAISEKILTTPESNDNRPVTPGLSRKWSHRQIDRRLYVKCDQGLMLLPALICVLPLCIFFLKKNSAVSFLQI